MDAREIVKMVKHCTPYPESVYPTMSDAELALVRQGLKAVGYTSDRVFGAWGRRVRDNTCDAILRRLEEAEREENSK